MSSELIGKCFQDKNGKQFIKLIKEDLGSFMALVVGDYYCESSLRFTTVYKQMLVEYKEIDEAAFTSEFSFVVMSLEGFIGSKRSDPSVIAVRESKNVQKELKKTNDQLYLLYSIKSESEEKVAKAQQEVETLKHELTEMHNNRNHILSLLNFIKSSAYSIQTPIGEPDFATKLQHQVNQPGYCAREESGTEGQMIGAVVKEHSQPLW